MSGEFLMSLDIRKNSVTTTSSSHHFFSLSLFPQCTQGTKGLLESATLPPLLSTSCPQ
ncbi:hypothetical protein KUCAC02_011521, partial [Chaenocephalus aceratus]